MIRLGPERAWMILPVALAIALAAQILLLMGQVLAGTFGYALALVCLGWGMLVNRELCAPAEGEHSRLGARTAVLFILLAGLWLRTFMLDTIPWGLNNDEGIEGLIACRFLSGVPITPFSDIGLSRETLYHLLLMPLIDWFGPRIWTLRFLSLSIGLICIPLMYWAGGRLFSRRVGVLAAALLAFSPWHILYSRTGFRNILVPLFVLAGLTLFHRTLVTRKITLFVLTGTMLGLGMYSYTSFRVIPCLIVVWALLRRFLLKQQPLKGREVGAILLPFLVLLIPQLVYAVRDPVEFLARGRYVLTQTPNASLLANLVYSLIMPVFYPVRFGVVQSLHYFGDGVSLVYAAVGRTPESAVTAALMACGFMVAGVRGVRDRSEVHLMLLLTFLGTVLTVGLAGPSLTRLISNLPLLCLMGALFLERLGAVLEVHLGMLARRLVVGGLLLAAALMGYDQYFNRAGNSEKAMLYYAYPQTLMGRYVASRPPGHPVFVFYSEQPEALQFLTYERRQWTLLYTDPAELDLEKIGTATGRMEFVLEGHRRFLDLFTTLARLFPWAESSFLADAKHVPDRRVAYVLDVRPQANVPQSPPPSPDASAPSP